MAIFSFSIKDSKSKEIQKVVELKKYCDVKGLSFSHLVVKAIINFKDSGALDE